MWIFAVLLFITPFLHAAPPKYIPHKLQKEFTLNFQMRVEYNYRDDSYSTPKVFTTELYDSWIAKALNREVSYYGATDNYLYAALDEVKDLLKGKEVGIIGSENPWYEAILMAYGALPVVIEYNPIKTSDPRVTYLTPAEYKTKGRKFDILLSISSTEHDGLGRYGDPIDPEGDFKSMATFKNMLTPNGVLMLAVPIGRDRLVWNLHRIYGRVRFPLLIAGWKIVKSFGFETSHLYEDRGDGHQPVFVLKPA
jgi:hypothetical protein